MAPADQQPSNPIEILLVEPNPGDVRLFTESFKEAQISNHVHTVSDGDSALDFLYQRGEYSDESCPDLILLDPQLPGTSGMDVLRELNNEPALNNLPVVVLTSSDLGKEIVKSQGLDADTFIQKPVEVDEFVEFVQSVEEFWLTITRQTA
ncbi:response regulator [Haloprofundus salilacus]|uniref:response regulator n=1 Tax=Haloprofundus salilacus TaxID=2876190 RepID=UPI001CCEFBBD|nr:response regulator [Haloprofundus salilacus]